MEYAAERAHGMRVLQAAGIESESELPFAALHLLLVDVMDHVAARQASALAAALGSGVAAGERFAIAVGLLELLAGLAEGRPVACLVDDAQWLDGASADALLFSARRLRAEGVAMIFAARDDPRQPFVADRVPTLAIGRLSAADAGAVIFLDEPTTGFDPAARRVAWDAIAALRDAGKTVLLTTHSMEEADALADRIAVLAGGRIVADGPPSRLAGRDRGLSTISYTLPADGGRKVVLRTATPLEELAQLADWSRDTDTPVADLRVAQPSLEAIYLNVIASSEAEEAR